MRSLPIKRIMMTVLLAALLACLALAAGRSPEVKAAQQETISSTPAPASSSSEKPTRPADGDGEEMEVVTERNPSYGYKPTHNERLYSAYDILSGAADPDR